jgi:hypothetical protein
LGFDLHVNSSGEFIATDLDATLDLNPSHAIANTVSTVVSPIANTVSSVVSPVADGLPLLNLATSDALDSLFGVDNHSVVGHLGDLTSVIPSGDISSEDPISGLKGNLGNNGAAPLGVLTHAFAATSPDGSPNTGLPIVGIVPAVGAVSDPAPVSIVGEATAITPGHSIDFPTPGLLEGDVLFHGNSYTDYHVALQSAGPSAGSGSIAAALTSVPSTPDATSLTHVDAPVATVAPSSSAATAATVQHQDALLTHISTTLDDLSLRSHTH